MKYFSLLLFPMALTACVRDDPTLVETAGKRVYTVNEFLAAPELRKKFMALCSNDPGRTETDPNCVNVVSAERVASAGAAIPRFVP